MWDDAFKRWHSHAYPFQGDIPPFGYHMGRPYFGIALIFGHYPTHKNLFDFLCYCK